MTILMASFLNYIFPRTVNAIDQALRKHEQIQEQLHDEWSMAKEAAKVISSLRDAGRLLLGETLPLMGIVKKWGKVRYLDDDRVNNLPAERQVKANEILQLAQSAFQLVYYKYYDLLDHECAAER